MAVFLHTVFDHVRPYYFYVTLFALLLILVPLVIHAYYRLVKTVPEKKQSFDDVSNDLGGGKELIELHLFYAQWCPACKRQKPEWNTFKKKFDHKILGKGIMVTCIEHDCTESEDPLVAADISKYHINQYPTVIGYHGNQKVTLDAAITEDSLELFSKSLAGL
jgi:thiol-disulfide isomerase/thioredoxin